MSANPHDAADSGGRSVPMLTMLRQLCGLPRAFWVLNLGFGADGFAYFGVLILLGPFLTGQIGVLDKWATVITGAFAACVTLFMFGFGSFSERFGVRRAFLASILILLAGRVLLGLTPLGAGYWSAVLVICGALFIMAAGEGVLQTANYSGIKQFSSESVNAVAFGLNYGLMNAGIVLIGFLSAEIRTTVDQAILLQKECPIPSRCAGWDVSSASNVEVLGAAAGSPAPATQGAGHSAQTQGAGQAVPAWAEWAANYCGSGVEAVFWLCAAVTALMVAGAWLTFTPAAERQKLRPESEQRIAARRAEEQKLSFIERLRLSPFADARFTYFVFILMPARTLFGYQIHIFGNYILRTYPKEIGDRFEYFSNVVNPLTVVLLSPVFAALFRRTNLLTLMTVGSLVTALPTFLLCLPEQGWLLLAYTVIFSAGEALWQPRFYEFAANIAPEGRMGAYMAAANMPWLIAKFGTGLYSGWMLGEFCPPDGPNRAWIMWAIFGVIAMISPIGLIWKRRWLLDGLRTGPARA